MRRKIILSLFVLFIVFSVGAATSVLYITDITSELNHIIELHQVEQLRRSLVINLQTVQSHLYTINTPFAEELDSIVHNVIALEETAKKCSSCHHPRKLENRITQMQSLIKDYESLLSFFITLRANSERLKKFKEEAVIMGHNLIQSTESMSHSATTSLADLTSSAMAEVIHVKFILLTSVTITFLLGVMVAAILTRSVTRPVNALVNATRMISSGKFGSTISYEDKTEFGELATHFNTMSTAIKEGYDKIQKEMIERRQTAEALRESEERFRTFFEVAPIGIVIYPFDASPLSKSLEFATFNSAFHEFLGYTREELSKKSIVDITYSEDIGNNIELSNELLQGKRDSYSLEKRYINKNGEIIWGFINVAVLRSPQGNPSQIMTTVADITERKKIEEEHSKIQKLESVGILAGGIAHDFNNILTAIVGNIALAKMSLKSGKNIVEILEGAEKACWRAKNLTNQLLTFSKGGAPIKKITHIAAQLKESVRFALRGSNVHCEFFVPDDLWPVEIDEGQINQVIFNLVINANQAMPHGGTIRIRAENTTVPLQSSLPLPYREYITIIFEDEGTGIPPEHIKKIFDPYFTTKQKGSGLGLASTYSIIKNHAGHIDVQSAKGTGTAFHIYLPAMKEKLSIRENMIHTIPQGEGKILLMDDDENIRSTVTKALMTFGYHVESARDGAEAIEFYKNAAESAKPFDAVIMDLTIRGGMGGKEAIERLLAIDPQVKVIVSSGYSHDPIMANYGKYGFCGVISKPYEIETLNELLRKVVTGPTNR